MVDAKKEFEATLKQNIEMAPTGNKGTDNKTFRESTLMHFLNNKIN